MNIKLQTLSIVSLALILLAIISISPSLALAQTNQTESVEEKLKTASKTSVMKAIDPGDIIFILICPEDFQDIYECQFFAGQPL